MFPTLVRVAITSEGVHLIETPYASPPTNIFRENPSGKYLGRSAYGVSIRWAISRDNGYPIIPGEQKVPLSFAYLARMYIACSPPAAEQNMINRHKQYQVCEYYADVHLRYQIMPNQFPMQVVKRNAASPDLMRQSHAKAKQDGDELAQKAAGIVCTCDVRDLISTDIQSGGGIKKLSSERQNKPGN